MSEKIKIQNDSGDRKYFTIIPNYILNHSTLWDREVYIQMKRITGEDGTCWTSRNTLAKQCGISINRLQKSIKYLVEHHWIEQIGTKPVMTKGGVQEVNEYRVCDLWNINNEFYQKNKGGSLEIPPLNQRGVMEMPKGGHHMTSNKNHINKNPTNAETSSAVDIPLIIKAFEEIDLKNKRFYGNKTQREACAFLIDNYGLSEVLVLIPKLKETNKTSFYQITTPLEMVDKITKVFNDITRKKSDVKSKGRGFV